jgi:type IV secretory pathway VirB2 component (pilin)
MLRIILKAVLNKTLTRLSLAIPALLAVSTASAHPSGHMEFTMSQVINHMLASPFHTGIMVAGIVAIAFAINLVSKRKGSKANKLK